MSDLGNPNFVNPTKIQKWESPLFAVTANSTHTFPIPPTTFDGQRPDKAWLELEITTNTGDYVVGDVIMVSTFHAWDQATSANNNYGITVHMPPANNEITARVASNGIVIYNLNTGAANNLATKCSARIRAERTAIGDQPDITRVGLVALEREVVNSGDVDIQIDWSPYLNEYDNFKLLWSQLQPVTDGAQIVCRLSNDGGVTFQSGVSDYDRNYIRSDSGTVLGVNDPHDFLYLSSQGIGGLSAGGANEATHGYYEITGAGSPNQRTALHGIAGGRASDNAGVIATLFGQRVAGEINTGIQIYADTGNLASGIVTLYGYRKVA